jgi:pyridoxamine 5'-phosphate oxidase
MNIANMRAEYGHDALRREDLKADPVEQFTVWFEQAGKAGILEPNAMSVATATPDGRPSLRTVLLKAYDNRGFVFFTNLESKKARQISENPNVALMFLWLPLERQLIITGKAEKLSVGEVLAYFVTRPLDSQLAAWASPQSHVITSRKILEMKWQEMKSKFSGGKVPLPSFWGGYRVHPTEFEFWQGGAHRLHDRFQYTRQPNNSWNIERLAP